MKRIFIIPYRDRESQLHVFLNHMRVILDGENEFVFVHQQDKRIFNRGALKNIGFLYARQKYPQEYKNMTFVFHDIDFVPYKKGQFDYETTVGTIKHFYGFKFALGGMFAVKGSDFEKIYGFPNYWGWGFEDNKIQQDWIKSGGKIDYSQWLPIHHKDVVQFSHGWASFSRKNVNERNLTNAKATNSTQSGFHTIRELKYNVDEKEDRIMVNVTNFLTEVPMEEGRYSNGTVPKKRYVDHKIYTMGDILRSGRSSRRR